MGKLDLEDFEDNENYYSECSNNSFHH